MDTSKRPSTTGLLNLGNTCYLNSILQCLSYCPDLFDYLTDNEFDIDLRPAEVSHQFAKEFRKVLIQLWYKNQPIRPGDFKGQMEQLIMKKMNNSGLCVGWQNDAHEFLEFLFETIHDSLKYFPDIKIQIKNEGELSEVDKLAISAYKQWKNHFTQENGGYSKIIDLFYGQFISEIRKNDNVSINFEPFQVLSLEIPKKPNSEITLTDCLDKFMAPEKITSTIQKRFYFWKTPKNLVITLKRFTSNSQKDETRVVYRDILDLSKYSKGYRREKLVYSLYAICCHHSSLTNFGHYTAICRKPGNKKWFRINDESVECLGNDGALPLTSNAYMLFYRQV